MTDRPFRLTPDTPTLARDLGNLVRVGPGFVHLDPRLYGHPTVERIRAAMRLGPGPELPELVSLFGDELAALPGAEMSPLDTPELRPRALWIARTVYGTREAVDVAVVVPPAGGQLLSGTVRLSVGMSGGRTRDMSVKLTDGVGRLRLPAMPPGAWAVKFEGAHDGVRFTVVESQSGLPLVAAWLHRHVRKVAAVSAVPRYICNYCVRLLSHDHPVAGKVAVSLTNPRLDHRVALSTVIADPWGVVRGSAELVGVGPFVLSFECEGVGGREARLTIPLPARGEDATLPDHSFVPQADRFLVFLPLQGKVALHEEKLPAIPAPVAVVVAADACRKERVHVVRPPRGGVEVAWDGTPGERVRITTGTSCKVLMAAWIGRVPGPFTALEDELRAELHGITSSLLKRQHMDSLFEACGGDDELQRLLEALAGAPERPRAGRFEGVEQDFGGVVAPLPVLGDDARLLRMEIVSVDGDALVQLPPAPGAGMLTVEVVVCGPDGGWASARVSHVVGPGFDVQWHLPAYVADGDSVVGRLVVRSDVDASLVRLTRNRRPVERTLEPDAAGEVARPAPLGVPLPRRARIGVALRPGLWVAEVECPRHGGAEQVIVPVSEPGRRRATVRRFRFVGPGEVARRADGDGPLRVLGSPRDEIDRVSRSVLDAPYRTCESLAAMCVATALRFAHGLGSHKRLGLLEELVEDLEALFEPGRGFAVRERHGPMDDALCELAARHLVRLEWVVREVLQPLAADSPEITAVVKLLGRAVHLGARAVRTLGLVLPPPPKTLRHADDAELLASMRPERTDIAAATARGRLKRRVSRMDVESIDPRAAARTHEGRRRSDRAFAACLLLRTGDQADIPVALEALSQAMGDSSRSFLPRGGGFGTEDAVALLLALHEVESESHGELRCVRSGQREESAEDERLSPEEATGDFDLVEVVSGACWVGWETTAFDDLTDPASPIPLSVFLRGQGQRTPATEFELGDLVEVHVGLGSPAQGHGYAHGDWVEVHLPPALIARERPLGDIERNVIVDDGGRRVRVELAGAHGAVIHARAVMATGTAEQPALQRWAAGVRNVYEAGRGCGRLGLDVAVFPKVPRKPGGLFGLFR